MHSPYFPVYTEMFVQPTDDHQASAAVCPVATSQSRTQAVLFLLTLPTALLILFLSLCLSLFKNSGGSCSGDSSSGSHVIAQCDKTESEKATYVPLKVKTRKTT
jgi:hypothetical protein